MGEFPPGGLQIAAEVARIASTPDPIDRRAEALLEPLHRIVPFCGVWLSLLDAELRTQPPLISRGYPEPLIGYMSGPEGVLEIEVLGLNKSARATRTSDLLIPSDEVRSWADYLAPAGFRGGVATSLFTPDGRYLGMLGLNTDTAEHPTAAARDLLGALSSTIAHAIDPMRAVAAAANLVSDAQAAVALTRDGHPLAVPGLPPHGLMNSGSTVLAAASAQMAAGFDHATFLSPDPSGGGFHVRITVLGCRPQPATRLCGVVMVSPAGDLHGLDHRELQILGLLVDDRPDEQIATALGMSPLEVAGSVERISAKLGAPNRTVAILRAVRQGLYIPHLLFPFNGRH